MRGIHYILLFSFIGLFDKAVAQTTLTLPELLQLRFTTAVTATTYEDCRVLPCEDHPDCDAGVSGMQDDVFIDQFTMTGQNISRTVEVQCDPEDSTQTVEEQVLDLTDFHLPATLYRIRLCGSNEGYVLGDIDEALSPYQIVQEISLTSYDQPYTVTIDGVGSTVNLETLLSEIFLNGAAYEPLTISDDSPGASAYIMCGEEVCETITTACTPAASELQNEIIDYLHTNAPTAASITYPITLHLISLCGDATLWVTADELDLIDETPIQTIRTITLSGPDDPITINDPVRGSDYIDDISVETSGPSCDAPSSGSILISITGPGADQITRYSIDGGESYQSSPLFQNLVDGGYIIQVSNADGSISTTYDKVITLQNPCLENDRESCADGIDNDGDGLVDCEDGNCGVSPDCNPDVYCEVLSEIRFSEDGLNVMKMEFDQKNMSGIAGNIELQDLIGIIQEIRSVRLGMEQSFDTFPQLFWDTSYVRMPKWIESPLKYQQKYSSELVMGGNIEVELKAIVDTADFNPAKYFSVNCEDKEVVEKDNCNFSITVDVCYDPIDDQRMVQVTITSDVSQDVYVISSVRDFDYNNSELEYFGEKGSHLFTIDGDSDYLIKVRNSNNCSEEYILSSRFPTQIRIDAQVGDCITEQQVIEALSCGIVQGNECFSWIELATGMELDSMDNCIIITNPGMAAFTITREGFYIADEAQLIITVNDKDNDGIGNGQDPDIDGDSIPNGMDNDIDGDGVLNHEDDDIDGDGILNDDESSPEAINGTNTENCNVSGDDDGDGLDDCVDPDCTTSIVIDTVAWRHPNCDTSQYGSIGILLEENGSPNDFLYCLNGVCDSINIIDSLLPGSYNISVRTLSNCSEVFYDNNPVILESSVCENCENGIDDDGDGYDDCSDADCVSKIRSILKLKSNKNQDTLLCLIPTDCLPDTIYYSNSCFDLLDSLEQFISTNCLAAMATNDIISCYLLDDSGDFACGVFNQEECITEICARNCQYNLYAVTDQGQLLIAEPVRFIRKAAESDCLPDTIRMFGGCMSLQNEIPNYLSDSCLSHISSDPISCIKVELISGDSCTQFGTLECPDTLCTSNCLYQIKIFTGSGLLLADEEVYFSDDSLTFDDLRCAFMDTDSLRLLEVLEAFNENNERFGINTALRISHFIGQIGHETNGLTSLSEEGGLCHTESSIKRTWGNVDRGGPNRVYCDLFVGYSSTNLTTCPQSCNPPAPHPDSLALSMLTVKPSYYGTGPDCNDNLLDYVYACRGGNRAPSTGDGSVFSGKGFIQLTFRGNYQRISNAWNQDSITNGGSKNFHLQQHEGGDLNDLVDSIDVSMRAAMYYWQINQINSSADIGLDTCDIFRVSALINNPGQRNNCSPGDLMSDLDERVNGFIDRYSITQRIWECLN